MGAAFETKNSAKTKRQLSGFSPKHGQIDLKSEEERKEDQVEDYDFKKVVNVIDSLETRMMTMKTDVDILRENNMYNKTVATEKAFAKVQRELFNAKRDYALLRAHHENMKCSIRADRKNRDGKIVMLFQTINKLNQDKYNQRSFNEEVIGRLETELSEMRAVLKKRQDQLTVARGEIQTLRNQMDAMQVDWRNFSDVTTSQKTTLQESLRKSEKNLVVTTQKYDELKKAKEEEIAEIKRGNQIRFREMTNKNNQ